MAANTQRSADHSALVGIVRQLRAWLAASWLVRTGKAVTSVFATAVDMSTLVDGARTLTHYTRQSFCYRWLTKEPDSDVVVIDLRETYTVGPFIAVLDRVRPAVEPTWHESLAYRISERLGNAQKWEAITESRTIQLLKAALEPPERPQERQER